MRVAANLRPVLGHDAWDGAPQFWRSNVPRYLAAVGVTQTALRVLQSRGPVTMRVDERPAG